MRTRSLVAATAVLLLPTPRAAAAQPACTYMSVADYVADPLFSCVLGGRLLVSGFSTFATGFTPDLNAFGLIPVEEAGYVGFHLGSRRDLGPEPIVGTSELPGIDNLRELRFSFHGESLTGAPVTGFSARFANGWWDLTPAAGWYARAWTSASLSAIGGETSYLSNERYTPGLVPVGLYPSVCSLDGANVPCGTTGVVHADHPTPSASIFGQVGIAAVVVDQGGLPKTPGEIARSVAGQGGIYLDLAAAPVSAVPEPATVSLLAAGLAMVVVAARGRRG